MHIGAVTDKSGFKLAESADYGGPLGELVQWSDLLGSLYLLGHTVEVSTKVDKLKWLIGQGENVGPCSSRRKIKFDVIYIDIVGLKQLKRIIREKLQFYK